MDNEEEMDKFLEKYNFPKLDQEEIENLNRHIKHRSPNCNQKSSSKQAQNQTASQLNFTKNLEKS